MTNWFNRLLPGLQQRLVFVHVAKCGGQSVVAALRPSYLGPEDRLRARSPERHIDAIRTRRTVTALFPDLEPESDAWWAEVLGQRRRLLIDHLHEPEVRFIHGHVPIRDDDLDLAAAQDVLWTTLLRDPVDRWLSHHYFRRHKEAPMLSRPASVEQRLDELEEHSVYAKVFAAGHPQQDLPGGVAQAIRALNRFAVVGVLERMPEFGEALGTALDVTVSFPHRNRTNAQGRRRREEEVTTEVRERLEEVFWADRAIHDHAVQLSRGAANTLGSS